MFDHTHYVPILKGKAGEFAALGEITVNCKKGFTPLIEMMWEGKDKEKIEKECKKLMDVWANPRPIFLDVYREIGDDGSAATNPFRHYLDCARKIAFPLIPVTGLNRAANYQNVVRDANTKDKHGICLRLEPDDLGDIDLVNRIGKCLGGLEVPVASTDLLIDFKEIPLTQVAVFQMMTVSVLDSIKNIKNWRTLTLAATTFPISMGSFQSAQISTRPRGEWTIWTAIRPNKVLQRIPTFGDYAVANPVITDFDPIVMDMTANIRYTIDGNWLIVKGRGVKKHGYGQFAAICRALVGRPEFCGRNFSTGDAYIADCATNAVGTGNMTTWRKVGTNHHLTFVVDRIARLPVP